MFILIAVTKEGSVRRYYRAVYNFIRRAAMTMRTVPLEPPDRLLTNGTALIDICLLGADSAAISGFR